MRTLDNPLLYLYFIERIDSMIKLETKHLILYPLTAQRIKDILNDEPLEYSTKIWLTHDNTTLLTWMLEELYAFMPPKLGFTSWIFIEKSSNEVIGDGGYKGNPDDSGQVEIGYEIIESKRKTLLFCWYASVRSAP